MANGSDEYATDDFLLPRQDESGDVDLSLIESTLRLSPTERAERHYQARLFAQRLRKIARERYGSVIDDLDAVARSAG